MRCHRLSNVSIFDPCRCFELPHSAGGIEENDGYNPPPGISLISTFIYKYNMSILKIENNDS